MVILAEKGVAGEVRQLILSYLYFHVLKDHVAILYIVVITWFILAERCSTRAVCFVGPL